MKRIFSRTVLISAFALFHNPTLTRSQDYSSYNQFSTPNVQFNTYTPKPIHFESSNTSVMQRSLQQYEQRQNRAHEYIIDYYNYMADLQQRLSPDEETQRWFRTTFENYKKELEHLYSIGYYGDVGTRAVNIKYELESGEAYAREKSWEEYKKEVTSILSHCKINEITQKRWLELNPYVFKPRRNSEGKIYWFEPFEPSSEFGLLSEYPVDDINWEEIFGECLNRSDGTYSSAKNIINSTFKYWYNKEVDQDFHNRLYIYNKLKDEYIKLSPSSSQAESIKQKMDSMKKYLFDSTGQYYATHRQYIDMLSDDYLAWRGVTKQIKPVSTQTKPMKSPTTVHRKRPAVRKKRR